jgi:hypothetical protein
VADRFGVRFELEVRESHERRMKVLDKLVANIRRDVTFMLRDGTLLVLAQDQAPITWRWTVPLPLVEGLEKKFSL